MPPVFGYRPKSNNNLIPSGHPVSVIVSFKTTGEYIPLYFQIEDDNCELFKYKINSISAIKDKPGVKIFVCSYISNGFKNIVTLCFNEVESRWVIG